MEGSDFKPTIALHDEVLPPVTKSLDYFPYCNYIITYYYKNVNSFLLVYANGGPGRFRALKCESYSTSSTVNICIS
nr:MAG TPA: hypothetical protein [Caudoviricetes sp.]